MSKVQKSEMVCIDHEDGKPCLTLEKLAAEVTSMAGFGALESHYDGVVKRIAQGRRRVIITITVEDA